VATLALALGWGGLRRVALVAVFAVLSCAASAGAQPRPPGSRVYQPSPLSSAAAQRVPQRETPPPQQQTPPPPEHLPTLEMPDVRGMSLGEAQLTLRRQVHQIATRIGNAESARPRGDVIRQSPQPGALVSPRTPISLVLSAGPPAAPPPVFQPEFPPPRPERPPPREQAPPPEEPPPEPELVAVPQLVGLTAIEARNRLGLYRLLLGRPTQQPSPNPSGRILSTTPPAGTMVRRGSSVDYMETSGRNIVPSVVGLSQAQAGARLDAAGFGHAVEPAPAGQKPLDVVAAQSPAGGSEGYVGDDVRLVLRAAAPPPPAATPTPPAAPPRSPPAPPKPPAATKPPAPTTTTTTTTPAPTPPAPPSTAAPPPPPAASTAAGSVEPPRPPPPPPPPPPRRFTTAEKLGGAALLLAVLAAAGGLALRAMVKVSGVLQGGVEYAATSDDLDAPPAGPAIVMNWDLQLEPPGSDEVQPTTPKPTEEAAS
jgi:beta-lactam-binding protein with PASTA domain